MAEKEFIEGRWSLGGPKYEYVEIFRDDRSCRKRFKWREEEDLAEAYYNHLQSLDNQLKTYHEQKRAADEQKRAADELEAIRKAAEEKNRIERERPFRPSFPPPPRQVIDPEYREWLQYKNPEYQEWLQFKKATDPEFAKWKREKEEAARRQEEARRRAVQEAEQKRIADELARKKKLEEEQKEERIKNTIWWIVGLAIAAGLIFLVVQYWETILAILVIIFLLYLFLK